MKVLIHVSRNKLRPSQSTFHSLRPVGVFSQCTFLIFFVANANRGRPKRMFPNHALQGVLLALSLGRGRTASCMDSGQKICPREDSMP